MNVSRREGSKGGMEKGRRAYCAFITTKNPARTWSQAIVFSVGALSVNLPGNWTMCIGEIRPGCSQMVLRDVRLAWLL